MDSKTVPFTDFFEPINKQELFLLKDRATTTYCWANQQFVAISDLFLCPDMENVKHKSAQCLKLCYFPCINDGLRTLTFTSLLGYALNS
ncbi:MAG: hypothetical protein H0U49_06235 [Parachlamydiaceae bacterium]|nr:hypothetical protein [Parachlamydiaceae bacterium]